MKRFLYIFLIFCVLSVAAQPKHEVRAVWLTTLGGLDWPKNYAHDGMGIQRQQEDLCRILDQLKAINEPLVNGEPMTIKAWDEATEKVQAFQKEWRTIGFAPKKFNQPIYDEYRAECDRFFHTKTEFYHELRERRKEREQKHKEYLERVKAREERAKAQAERAAKAIANQGADGLRRMRDKLQQEIKTAENNILFFTAKSKGANRIVDDMRKKIEELKAHLAEIEQQMDAEDNG